MTVHTSNGNWFDIDTDSDILGGMVKHESRMYHVTKLYDMNGTDLRRFRKDGL